MLPRRCAMQWPASDGRNAEKGNTYPIDRRIVAAQTKDAFWSNIIYRSYKFVSVRDGRGCSIWTGLGS